MEIICTIVFALVATGAYILFELPRLKQLNEKAIETEELVILLANYTTGTKFRDIDALKEYLMECRETEDVETDTE